MDSNIIVGIDLGTTNSVVSFLNDKTPQTLLIDNSKLLPSAVCFTDEGFVVGQAAKNMAILEPENTSLSIKRRMGENITIKLGGKSLRPEEIASLILKKIAMAVKSQLEYQPEKLRAVVTVPAYFTEEQREATKQAAELANLQVERIINEPTAAALSFGLDKLEGDIFAIYDLGGGTFDVSIVENNAGIIEVLATTGNNHLGGDDFDKLLADYIWDKFRKKNKIKSERLPKVNARLLKIAEETKIALSDDETVSIKENFFIKEGDKTHHLDLEVSRIDFENLINKHIIETVDLLDTAVHDADCDISDLEGIILVGGSSRIPLITNIIEEKLKITPSLIELPDEAVSHGATIQGAIINKINIDTVLVDITPYSLGLKALARENEDNFEDMMNSMLERMMKVEEDEEDENFITGVIIPKNTPIPAKRTRTFGATIPFQKAYGIEVFQGEHIRPHDNRFIGKTMLEVEEPQEHGGVDVTFELDINGLLKVTATQINTNETVKAEFTSSRGKKLRKTKLLDKIVSLNDSDKTLIKRAEKLLDDKSINEEDRNELSILLDKFKNQKMDNDPEATSTENDLLDLLYFLEGNE